MPDRDYAAPIPPGHRKSVWEKLTGSLELTTNWDSGLPLTADLRERFPGLLRSRTPAIAPSLVSPVSVALQQGQHAIARQDHPCTREDSVQDHSARSNLQRDPRTTVQGGGSYQRPPQQRACQPAQLPPIRPHSPIWNVDLYENPRPAPGPSISTFPPQLQQQGNASHMVYQRNAQVQLLPIGTTFNGPRGFSIRRKALQSSLRNQVQQQDSHRTQFHPVSDASNCASSTGCAAPVNLQTVGYTHFPVYSPLPFTQPHDLPQPPVRSSSGARHAAKNAMHNHNSAPLRRHQKHDRNTPHITTVELQATPFVSPRSPPRPSELQGSLAYDPPAFPSIPLLSAEPPARPSLPSNASVATFENLNANARPALTRHGAQIEGVKNHLNTTCRGWVAKAIRLGKSINHYGHKCRRTNTGPTAK